MIDERAILKHAALESKLRQNAATGGLPHLVVFYPETGTYTLDPYSLGKHALADFQARAHQVRLGQDGKLPLTRVLGIVRCGVVLAQLERPSDGIMNGARRTFEYIPEGFAPDILYEVYFGLTFPDGSTSGQMALRWYDLYVGTPVPRLECLDDAFSAMASFSDMIEALGELNDQNITPQSFMQFLTSLGFSNRKEAVRE